MSAPQTTERDPTPEEVEAMYEFAHSRGFRVHVVHGEALRALMTRIYGAMAGQNAKQS